MSPDPEQLLGLSSLAANPDPESLAARQKLWLQRSSSAIPNNLSGYGPAKELAARIFHFC
jgi:hypothetical protein